MKSLIILNGNSNFDYMSYCNELMRNYWKALNMGPVGCTEHLLHGDINGNKHYLVFKIILYIT